MVDSKHGIQITNQLRIDDYKFVPQLYELTEAVHSSGAKIAIQINSAGSGMRPHLSPGLTPIAPSPVEMDFQPFLQKELELEEIREIILDFGRGAKLAKLAGFDAIEIHAAHGYLIGQFLSPFGNKRTDSYGGNFDNRLRFCLEVIEEVRKEVGPDFPLLLRLSIDEFIGELGLTLADSIKIAQEVERAGINAIDISAGNLNMKGSCVRSIPSIFVEDGHLMSYTKILKENINIPVIIAGKIRDPELAEKIISEEFADFVGFGRGLVCDPELPLKSQTGHAKEIRQCISCNDMCIYRKTWLSHPIRCSLNPTVGREAERIEKAVHPKQVAVIGGGPAGMEAARVATMRGHRVTLFEKDKLLGGQLPMAWVMPIKSKIKSYVEYLENQLNELNVTICLGQEITPDKLKQMNFEAIIVAAGAQRKTPDIIGIQNKNVFYYDDILLGAREVNGENIIVAGGGMIGSEVAMYLAEVKHKKVTLITGQDHIGGDIDPIFTGPGLLQRLAQDKITTLTTCKLEQIFDNEIQIKLRGARRMLGMDSIVIAKGRTPNQDLRQAIDDKVMLNCTIFSVGDCVTPRRLPDAVHEGFSAGLRV